MVTIRLMRMGGRKKPFYRIVVTDSRRPRESKAKDIVGYYDPLKEPAEIKMDMDKVNQWLGRGAQTSKTVQSLIEKAQKSE